MFYERNNKAMWIEELWHYPLKSAKGIALSSTFVQRKGFWGDREYLLVDEQFRFITQREYPILSQFHFWQDAKSFHAKLGLISFSLPVVFDKKCKVLIWQDTVESSMADEATNQYLSILLGFPCFLVKMATGAKRPLDPDYAKEGDEVSYSDGYPILACNKKSLQALEQEYGNRLDMSRFRPNIVFESSRAFEEESWNYLHINGTKYRVAKPCGRCQIVTIDQNTGISDPKVLGSLAQINRKQNKVYFGVNLVPESTGFMQLGDRIVVE